MPRHVDVADDENSSYADGIIPVSPTDGKVTGSAVVLRAPPPLWYGSPPHTARAPCFVN
jgi:hypothetical protein